MIAVVDYGVGNLYSLGCSLNKIGADWTVTSDEAALEAADAIILPGVGAFGDAADKLRALRLDAALKRLAAAGKPLMGICLGMQLLFDESDEYGRHQGLGLIAGRVEPLAPILSPGAKTPHMGWNSLTLLKPDDALTRGLEDGAYVYFVHSYLATGCESALVATAEYGGAAIPGVVRCGNVCGTQFHPEKSGAVGLRILRGFAEGGRVC